MSSIITNLDNSLYAPTQMQTAAGGSVQAPATDSNENIFSENDEVIISPEAQAAFQDEPTPGGFPPTPPDPEPPGT